MEPAANRAATESATGIAATSVTTAIAATIPGYTASVAITTTVSVTAIITTSITIAPTTAEPRSGAYKHTAIKPTGAVISIGRACVRRITIIAISTCGRITANANPHRNLRVRLLRRRQEKPKSHYQCQIP